MNSFINRTISGAFLLILSFICIYFKGYLLIGYSLSITILCLNELFNTFKIDKKFIRYISFLFSFVSIYSVYFLNINLFLITFILYFFIICMYYLFFSINILTLSKILFSYIYISIPMSLFLRLSNNYLLFVVFFICWGTDTFAYLFGIIFGCHKLCPNISPKKTIEGAIGGIFGSFLLLNLFNYFVLKYNIFFINIFSIILSIIAQLGDLFASKIKRELKIKDFSNIIKGHGGILDRFDSILFITPLVYIIFFVFGGNI